jgi:hypothetical protein
MVLFTETTIYYVAVAAPSHSLNGDEGGQAGSSLTSYNGL